MMVLMLMMLRVVRSNLHFHVGREREAQPVIIAPVIIIHGLHLLLPLTLSPPFFTPKGSSYLLVSPAARQLNDWEANKLMIAKSLDSLHLKTWFFVL